MPDEKNVSRLKVAKLSTGKYGWGISLAAGLGSLDELRVAEEAAVAISRELEVELEGSGNGEPQDGEQTDSQPTETEARE